jgi:hypothetical protein
MERSQIVKPLTRPQNLADIITTFGNINNYIITAEDKSPVLNPAFELKYIVPVKLPYKLQLAWDHKESVSTIMCHTLLADRFLAAFNESLTRELTLKASYFGGCFAFRKKRNRPELSAHAWGIAIDLNPETNGRGTSGDMAPEVVEIFHNLGFIWGGAWKGAARDPMHFQYCSGY